jgi:NAD(P)-dependent dehydrogenase (short-subunit alcohol dehydrogenase family)
VHAGSDQDHEGPVAARRPHHQQRVDLRARAAPQLRPYTATKHAVTGLTKSTSLDGRKYDIACSQIDIGNAHTDLAARMAQGVPQANGQVAVEPLMDVAHVASAVVYMASLPWTRNVQFMTIMATKMPFVGRG